MYEWLNVASYLQFQGVYNNDQWLPTSEWGLAVEGRRLLLMICAIQTQACVVTFNSREVLIHAGIMHAGRLWHLSTLLCSRAHLFGNGFTYIFFSMALPLPLPQLTALAHTHWVKWKSQTCKKWTITGCLGGVVHSLLAMLKVVSYCRWLCLRKSYYAFTWRIRHLQQWYLELEIFSFCRGFFSQVYNHSKVYNNLLTLHIWKH